MAGWKDWQPQEVVEESDFQSFIQDQVVQVYDDATDRDNTLGTAVAEGMVAYLKDVDSTIVYNGSAWIAVGAGDITAVTAGTALTGGGVSGDVTLDVDVAALATAHAGTALVATGEVLDVNETELFTTYTEGGVAYSQGTAGVAFSPAGTAGQVLTSTGTAVEWAEVAAAGGFETNFLLMGA